MTKVRVIILLITFAVLFIFGGLTIFYARGYRLKKESLSIEANGLLVTNSDPNGAQVFVNGELETATNNTLHLKPGLYDIIIKKEGYLSWQKRLTIEKEVVTQVDAFLVPVAPSLTAFTFSGVINPVPNNDGTRLAYAVPFTQANSEKSGLWLTDISDLPLGFNREPKQITEGDFSDAQWEWSPDSQHLLLTTRTGVFLLDTDTFTPQNSWVNKRSKLAQIQSEWEEETKKRLEADLRKLPDDLASIIERKAEKTTYSPDGTRVLYTMLGNDTLKPDLIKALPGSSTQKEQRELSEGKTYVYDIKEDKNFLVAEDGQMIHWLHNSLNLVLPSENKIEILDYDGTNKQTIFTGRYEFPHAYPSPNTSRLLILTNLGASDSLSNLYWLSLK